MGGVGIGAHSLVIFITKLFRAKAEGERRSREETDWHSLSVDYLQSILSST